MSPATLRVKRGDTLSRVFAWQDADGVAIACFVLAGVILLLSQVAP